MDMAAVMQKKKYFVEFISFTEEIYLYRTGDMLQLKLYMYHEKGLIE